MSEQPDEDQSTTQSTESTTETSTETKTESSTQDPGAQESGAPGEVADSQLPEDLQPGEDNPLATHPDQTGNADDQIGADREEEPETAPLTRDEADYGSGAGGSSDSSSGSGSESGSSEGGDGTGDGRVQAQEDDGSDTLDNGGGGAG